MCLDVGDHFLLQYKSDDSSLLKTVCFLFQGLSLFLLCFFLYSSCSPCWVRWRRRSGWLGCTHSTGSRTAGVKYIVLVQRSFNNMTEINAFCVESRDWIESFWNVEAPDGSGSHSRQGLSARSGGFPWKASRTANKVCASSALHSNKVEAGMFTLAQTKCSTHQCFPSAVTTLPSIGRLEIVVHNWESGDCLTKQLFASIGQFADVERKQKHWEKHWFKVHPASPAGSADWDSHPVVASKAVQLVQLVCGVARPSSNLTARDISYMY